MPSRLVRALVYVGVLLVAGTASWYANVLAGGGYSWLTTLVAAAVTVFGSPVIVRRFWPQHARPDEQDRRRR